MREPVVTFQSYSCWSTERSSDHESHSHITQNELNLLQPSIVRVPSDDRNTEVARQLEEVLGAGRGPSILLCVREVDDGGAPLLHLAAEEVQHV